MNKDKTITITKSGLRIYPYKRKQSPPLESITSIYDSVYHKKDQVTGFYVPVSTFCTHSMSLSFIQKLFPDYAVVYDKPYDIHKIQKFDFNIDFELRPIQDNVIQKMVNLKEDRLFINLQTGQGKTVVGIYEISKMSLRTMILCYSTEVLSQWISNLIDFTNFDISRCLIISKSLTLLKILDGSLNVDDIDIFLCTPALLSSFAKSNSWNKVSELFRFLNIGVKIIDEAHRQIKTVIHLDAFTNVKHTYYLSADFSQSSHEKRQLYYKMFFTVPVIDVDPEFKEEIKQLRAVVVNYDSKPNQNDQLSVYSNYGFSNFDYVKYEFSNGMIFDIINKIVGDILKIDTTHKILVLTSMIEHVDDIYSSLTSVYPHASIGKYHSEVDTKDKSVTKKESNIIVSTYPSFSVGLDVADIRFVISCDQIDMITDNQAAGRARPIPGLETYYFMLIDKGFPYCTKKIKQRLAYLRETKVKEVFVINY